MIATLEILDVKAGINPSAKNAIKNMFMNYEKKERPDPAVLFNQPSTSQG